jgi:SAM-dependent methyltransferase
MKQRLLNWFYYYAGILFLILAKIKHHTSGYSPKFFSTDEIQRCIEYDISIVDNWLSRLNIYNPNADITGKTILELGPGSDLGIGLYLLSKNAKKYLSVDVYDLESKTSDSFYKAFFTYLEHEKQTDTAPLARELQQTKDNNSNRLNYICRHDFDIIKAVGDNKIDIVFSNAAFEHFEDIRQTIHDVSEITQPGSMLIISVDLKTHSRWIREKDPNNIYRYSNRLYKQLGTHSSPNRERPYKYKQILEEFGWKDITITPITLLENNKFLFTQRYLNKNFQDAINQMNYLSIWICATKLP